MNLIKGITIQGSGQAPDGHPPNIGIHVVGRTEANIEDVEVACCDQGITSNADPHRPAVKKESDTLLRAAIRRCNHLRLMELQQENQEANMTTINMKNSNIKDCDEGMNLSQGTTVNMDGSNIERCRTAIKTRDKPSLLASLGLYEDTPTEMLLKVLTAIENGADTPEKVQKAATDTGLHRFVKNGIPFLDFANAALALGPSIAAFLGSIV